MNKDLHNYSVCGKHDLEKPTTFTSVVINTMGYCTAVLAPQTLWIESQTDRS
jgi:hypothetical protein